MFGLRGFDETFDDVLFAARPELWDACVAREQEYVELRKLVVAAWDGCGAQA
jgi:hypothetical protein